MLKKIRVAIATVVIAATTFLFLDFTGAIHPYFGWLAKVQLVPAILSANLAVMVALALVTLAFGRVYCSALCPLGIMQDVVSWVSARRKRKASRFRYSKAKSVLRHGILIVFIIAAFAGAGAVVSLLDPYAAYGRMAANFSAPVYRLGNNLLAWFAEKADSYSLYTTEVWIKGWVTFGVASVTLVAIGALAWRGGRSYCNTVCPVGTALGFLSRFSIFGPVFVGEKCKRCGLCEKGCKASCIDSARMTLDRSRCVSCFNCVEKCRFGAMKYALRRPSKKIQGQRAGLVAQAAGAKSNAMLRRGFLSIAGGLAATRTLKAQQLHVDGGLAVIQDKKIPSRKTPLVPPGAGGLRNMNRHCTACQLCVSACPNNVLRPSAKLATLMQPEMHYDRGYCRPECTECSQVCPAGAINKITAAEKSAISIGHAVWIKENCVVNRDDIQCNACQQNCPSGAIILVARDPGYSDSLKIPVVDKELCIGCGACEHLCPARPFSAIHVEGNTRHHKI